jgi:hypothetical protein
MARNQSHDVMYDDYDERYMYGWIDSTDGDTVMARLEDNHGGAYQARIPKTAFPRSDRGRLTPGACFHWSRTLSTSDTPSGQSEFVLEPPQSRRWLADVPYPISFANSANESSESLSARIQSDTPIVRSVEHTPPPHMPGTTLDHSDLSAWYRCDLG